MTLSGDVMRQGMAGLFLLCSAFLFACQDQKSEDQQDQLEETDETSSEQRSGPNDIILIIADDLGIDAFDKICNLWGFDSTDTDYPSDLAPHLASFCQSGVSFSNATSNPVCSATRASILTGRYSYLHGIGNVAGGTVGIASSEITIPELLRASKGYAAANIGKWHLSDNQKAYVFPVSKKDNGNYWFDYYEGSPSGALSDFEAWDKSIAIHGGTGSSAVAVTNYATTENVDNAIAWVESQETEVPLFLWLALNAPHTPFHKPPESLLSSDSLKALSGSAEDISANPKLYYLASIQAIDASLGRLIAALEAARPDTAKTFIFISDNGGHLQVSDSSVVRSSKQTVYEGGIRVPIIVWGDKVNQNQGTIIDRPVGVVDIFRTVLEMADIDFSSLAQEGSLLQGVTVHSQSLMEFINSAHSANHSGIAYSEIYGLTGNSATSNAETIRDSQYKLIRFFNAAATEEFYDLQADFRETTNLISSGTSTLTSDQASSYETLKQKLDTIDALAGER